MQRRDFRKLLWAVRLVGLPFATRAVRRGNVARDRCLFIDAVVEYRRALDWMPWREDLLVQVGNCLKEFGDYEGAVRAYGSVTSVAELPEARKQANDAIARGGPGMLPFTVTEGVPVSGGASLAVAPFSQSALPNRLRPDDERSLHWLGTLKVHDRVGALARRVSYATIKLAQVGTLTLQRDGVQEPLLAGVIAIRGKVSSLTDLGQVEVWLGEGRSAQCVATAQLHRMKGGFAPLKMCSFNIWIDCANLPRGRHWLSVRTGGKLPPAGLFVTIGELAGAPLPLSDSFVPSPPAQLGGRALDDAVLSAPAQVRAASRSLVPGPVKAVLAIRADQLGDVSASLQALRRLRELFPGAKLTALVQPGVRAIIEGSAIADEVLTLELTYSHESERRHLSDDEQKRLTDALQARGFDLAIDLSPGDESRPLLLLTGATYLVGFNADRHPFLDFGITTKSRDKSNRLDNVAHAASVLTLVEALGIATAGDPGPVRLSRDGSELLQSCGLRSGHYVVIHTGARHALNCWPLASYLEVVSRLLESGDDQIVFFGGSDDIALLQDPRVRRFDIAAPELFDTLISNARLMIGNDSGPKHLAAVRGVPTVSIHVNRLNWNEWGQTGRGAIVSKRVPCAGCGLNDIELCARDAACIKAITVDEVMAATSPYLADVQLP